MLILPFPYGINNEHFILFFAKYLKEGPLVVLRFNIMEVF